MVLYKSINVKNDCPAPEWSDSPKEIKAIFSSHGKATKGSSCHGLRKKAFMTRAKAECWNRLKKMFK
jgi:hypothetical protein